MNESTTVKPKQNLYLILDLTPGVSQNDILHAYNRAKNTYSEDSVASYAVFDEESKDSILSEIEYAFSVLGNPAKRREYDVKMGFDSWKDESMDRPRSAPSVLANLNKNYSSPSSEFNPSPRKTHPNISVVASVKSNFVPNPEFESKIASCIDLTGEFLKAVRLYRQYSEEELSQKIRLSPAHITTIENELGEHLHHPVYLRGHLVLICQALSIPNEQVLAKTYIERLKRENKLGKPSTLT